MRLTMTIGFCQKLDPHATSSPRSGCEKEILSNKQVVPLQISVGFTEVLVYVPFCVALNHLRRIIVNGELIY